MDTLIRRQRPRVVGPVSLLAAAAALLHPGAANAGGPWGADYFPNVPLITQNGRVVRFYDDLLKGKAVAINLIYTRCTASCPLETARLAQVQRLLGNHVGKDVFFYSISIDPKHDTPEVLKAYAERFHVGPGWLFLTGKEEDIRLVSKKLGLSALTDDWSRDGHLPALMVGNEATGEWMRNSAIENPKFLASMMSDFFGWRNGKPVRTYAEPVQIPRAGKGSYLFQTRCAACHGIGGGDGLGPDLHNVTMRRQRSWLARYVAEPDRMLAEGDELAKELFAKYRNVRMPNMGLDGEEVSALLSYIEGESRAAVEAVRTVPVRRSR
ncbi:MAG TPA: SCO family protein [Candidatus Eisenbacteria bacterium]|nr:SCO family protein [Candidatus Eisenbacteria bacterium]